MPCLSSFWFLLLGLLRKEIVPLLTTGSLGSFLSRGFTLENRDFLLQVWITCLIWGRLLSWFMLRRKEPLSLISQRWARNGESLHGMYLNTVFRIFSITHGPQHRARKPGNEIHLPHSVTDGFQGSSPLKFAVPGSNQVCGYSKTRWHLHTVETWWERYGILWIL